MQMWGRFRAATARASRSKRSLNFVAWEVLIATVRSSHVAHLPHFTHATIVQERDYFIWAESRAGVSAIGLDGDGLFGSNPRAGNEKFSYRQRSSASTG
jgi:hypothetical protein